MDMNDLILIAKALSDPARVRVLILLLRPGELCVCEIVDAMEMSQSTLSSHLQIIRQAGLVTTRREGKWVYYGLEPAQAPLLEFLLVHHQATLDTDKRLQRDAQRLTERLKMRENGCCVVGFGPMDFREKGGERV